MFLYECEFCITVNGVYYRSFKSVMWVPHNNRKIADMFIAELFSDNEYFLGAKCLGYIG